MELIEGALSSLLPRRSGVSVHAADEWSSLACAREALERAGGNGEPRPGRAGPIWPDGFVGSVSHSRRVVIAAAATTPSCKSLGIDIEPVMSFARAERVEDTIATRAERRACASSPFRLTLLFSAKESLYKCLYPSVHAWFDFDAAEIVAWDDRERRVMMMLATDLGPFLRGTAIEARWADVAGHLVTAVVLS